MVVTTLPGPNSLRQRQVQKVTMDVNHVEFVGATPQFLELQRGVNERLLDSWVQTQGRRDHGVQFRLRHRVAAREQGNVMPLPHQLFGQIRDDPLGAAVEPGRHTFNQRGDLRDLHVTPFLSRSVSAAYIAA